MTVYHAPKKRQRGMTLAARRVLYLSASVIFLITAPLLVMYSQGYRFSLPSMKLYKTLSLALESTPSGASIFVNGELRGRTPLTLTSVSPGNYTIHIEREAYQSWQRNIDIGSRSITIGAHLIPRDLAAKRFITEQVAAVTLRNENEASLVTTSSIELVDPKSGLLKKKLSRAITNKVTQAVWSSNKEWLLVAGDREIEVYSADLTSQKRFSLQDGKFIGWSRSTDNTFFVLENKVLWEISVDGKKISAALGGSVLDAAANQSVLYLLTPGEGTSGNSLYSFDLEKKELVLAANGVEADSILGSTNRFLLTSYNKKVSILDTRAQTVIPLSISNVREVSIDPSESDALILGETEAWRVIIPTGASTLLGRFSDLRGGATFHDLSVTFLLHGSYLIGIDASDTAASIGSYPVNVEVQQIQKISQTSLAIIDETGVTFADFSR